MARANSIASATPNACVEQRNESFEIGCAPASNRRIVPGAARDITASMMITVSAPRHASINVAPWEMDKDGILDLTLAKVGKSGPTSAEVKAA